jgi:5-methylcytosine-specific restriction protein A
MAHKVKRDSFGDARRGTRHQRGYGTEWDKRRARILARDCGICQACLAAGHVHQGTEVDHIVPKAEGGTESDDNLQTICKAAHRVKTQQEAARGRGAASLSPPVAAGTGGVEMSGGPASRTDWLAKFSRSGVLGGGGIPTGAKGGA